MRTMRLLAITLLCATMPLASSAQENLKSAIQRFIADKQLVSYIKTSVSTESCEHEGVKKTSYYKCYAFELPAMKRKELDKMLEAFNKDTGVAYKVQCRDAGMDDNILSKVSYGEKLDKSWTFGSYKDRNYRLMFVRDGQDSLRRYFYAIWWTATKKEGKLSGQVVEIYSPDPQKRKTDTDDVAEAVRKALKIGDMTGSKVVFSGQDYDGTI